MFDVFLGLKFKDADVVRKYEQPKSGICSTLVIRWIKYKMVGNKNFWDSLESKINSATERQAYYEKMAKAEEKIKDVVDESWSTNFALRTLGGQANKLADKKPQQKKLKAMYQGIEMKIHQSNKIMDQMAQQIEATVARQGSATYIFLSPNEGSIGHVIGTYCESGKVFYFDPNMGEISVAMEDFSEWFSAMRLW